MGQFDGQVAVVTGGARGIGAEIARNFARGGATVVCADVLDTTEVVEEISAAGGKAEGRELDVTNSATAAETVAAIHEAHGKIDILVNNAGITRDQLLIRMKPEDWDLVLGINLDGVFNITQPTAKLMMKARSGRIVNVASVVGLMGNAGQANYAASKAGLIGFTKSLARELGPRNVTVNAVAPGYIQTPMTDKLSDDQRDALMKNVAIPRLGTPGDVANAVSFLAGPNASYITGVVLNISGGLYM
jgi:3-oxoacyl-[acyl-carrier protein] reductase